MDYKQFFGLREAPFKLTPDLDFFFPSETHQDALETLLYAVRAGEGFIQITGYPGTGKSLLLRKILKEIGESAVTVLILHANIRAEGLLQVIMADLDIDISHIGSPSRERLMPCFRDFLMDLARTGKQVIIIADEAQNLPDETLEELRMLSNLETEKAKLIQIILVGQLELEQKITHDRLSQLAQRITIRYRLKPLTEEETTAYIRHRLEIAAVDRDHPPTCFPPGIFGAIFRYSRGIPRLINIVCERSLMAAFVDGEKAVARRHLKRAITSIEGEPLHRHPLRDYPRAVFSILGILLFLAVLGWGMAVLPSSHFSKEAAGIRAPENGQGRSAASPGTKSPVPVAPKGEGPETTGQKNPPPAVETGPPRPSHPNAQAASAADRKGPADALTNIGKWISLPADGGRLALLEKDSGRLTVWQRHGPDMEEVLTLTVPWPYATGAFIVGSTQAKGRFIFNPEDAYFLNLGIEDERFWHLFDVDGEDRVIPLVVSDRIPLKPPPGGKAAPSPLGIAQSVRGWADAARAMHLDATMRFYANIVFQYGLSNHPPRIYTWERLRKMKANVWDKTKSIDLKLSAPTCVLNPLNPDRGYAVFHQFYRSDTFRDLGVKVLYFQRIISKNGGYAWKITGRLWLQGKPG